MARRKPPPEPEKTYTVELDHAAFKWLRGLVKERAERYGSVLPHYGPTAQSAAAAFEAASHQHDTETTAPEPVRRIRRRATAQPVEPQPVRKGIPRRPR